MNLLHLLLAPVLLAQNQSFPPDTGPDSDPKPLIQWTFDKDEPGTWKGKPRFETTNLRSPEFPHLASTNKSAFFPGKDVYLRVKEADAGVNLRFQNGDTITLEAWVNPSKIPEKGYAYIIGKGRTDSPGFTPENQNYAMRLTGIKNEAFLSFLFRSQGKPSEYHRWTSKVGFALGSGWHHVAVIYTFGKSDSIQGYIDGVSLKGNWDMGGATDRPPVVDADDLVIGSSRNGSPGNTFNGWLDEVAIYRGALSSQAINRHALHVVSSPTVDAKKLPGDKVLVEICEDGIPTADACPAQNPPIAESYYADAFGFFQLPNKYIDTGVRADRPNPFLMRASALVDLPAGSHRILLRGRGACRLYINGKLLLTTPFRAGITDGHNPIPTKYLNLCADFRFAPPGNRETWSTYTANAGQHLFVLETLVGAARGKTFLRPEIGETVVALSPQGSESFRLVAPKRVVPYTDAGWKEYADEQAVLVARLEKEHRLETWKKNAEYWNQRRAEAQQWLKETADVPVPPAVKGYPASNAIDHFLNAKLAQVAREQTGASKGTIDFHKQVKPILEAKCFSCHQGQKVKGGLRLDTRAGLLQGGKSKEAAVAIGRPDKSPLIQRVLTDDETEIMPPKGERLKAAEIDTLKQWVREGAGRTQWN